MTSRPTFLPSDPRERRREPFCGMEFQPPTAHACTCGVTTVLHGDPEPQPVQTNSPQPLPKFLVEDTAVIYGTLAFDVTRVCHLHWWASLPLPVIGDMHVPVCDLCEAERLAVDGRARYADLTAKREAGLL